MLAGSERRTALADALAKAALDPASSPLARTLAVAYLSDVEDLPFRFHPCDRSTEPRHAIEAEALAFWKEVRGLPRLDGYRRRVETAATVFEREGWTPILGIWLAEHTTFDPVEATAPGLVLGWRRWWNDRGAEDPRVWLASGLGIGPPVREESSFADVVERLAREPEGGVRRMRFHNLLTLIAPEGAASPLWPSGKAEPQDLVMAWRSAAPGRFAERPHVLRVAWLAVPHGEADPIVLWEEVHPIGIGESVAVRHETSVGLGPWGLSYGFHVPGLGYHAGAPVPLVEVQRLTTTLEWRKEGLVHFTEKQSTVQRFAGGSYFAGGGGGGDSMAGMILPESIHEEEGSEGSAGGPRVLLSLIEPPGSDERPWTAADWRAKLTANLRFIAEKVAGGDSAYAFHVRYQQSFWRLPRVAALIAVPGAASALADLAAWVAATRHETDLAELTEARLLAGDATVLDGPDTERKLAKVARRGSGYLTRVLVSAGAGAARIRDLALAALEKRGDELPIEVAAGIERAVHEGRLEAPAWLAAEVEGAAEKQRWAAIRPAVPSLAAALLFDAIVLFVALATLWPGRSFAARIRPASRLVFLGVFLFALHVDLAGRDLLPEPAGYAAAAAGALLLARAASGPARHVTPLAFGVALVADALARLGVARDWFVFASAIATAAGIAAIPLLARAREATTPAGPVRRRLGVIVFVAGYVLPVATAAALTIAGEEVILTGWRATAAFLLMPVCVHWALHGLERAARAASQRAAAGTSAGLRTLSGRAAPARVT